MTSPDGITWTARTAAEANGWYSVTYGNGLFVAVAYTGTNRVMTIDMNETSRAVHVYGSTTLQGTTRISTISQTALEVQAAAGTALLTANTADSIIQIGSATTNDLAVLLQLDQYNQATDPSGGVNGAMYYNTDMKKFRCYQDGAWIDCVATPATYIQNSTSPQTADFNITGNGVIGGTLTVTGDATFNGSFISFSNNVRGYNITVTNTNTTHEVEFDTAHTNTDYAVLCTPSWGTTCYVTDKTVDGFTLNFSNAAGVGAMVDWMVVR